MDEHIKESYITREGMTYFSCGCTMKRDKGCDYGYFYSCCGAKHSYGDADWYARKKYLVKVLKDV